SPVDRAGGGLMADITRLDCVFDAHLAELQRDQPLLCRVTVGELESDDRGGAHGAAPAAGDLRHAADPPPLTYENLDDAGQCRGRRAAMSANSRAGCAQAAPIIQALRAHQCARCQVPFQLRAPGEAPPAYRYEARATDDPAFWNCS